jgi:hypothetical protein
MAERVIDYYEDCDPGRVYWLESADAFRDALVFKLSLSPALKIAPTWIVGAHQQLKTHVNKY